MGERTIFPRCRKACLLIGVCGFYEETSLMKRNYKQEHMLLYNLVLHTCLVLMQPYVVNFILVFLRTLQCFFFYYTNLDVVFKCIYIHFIEYSLHKTRDTHLKLYSE